MAESKEHNEGGNPLNSGMELRCKTVCSLCVYTLLSRCTHAGYESDTKGFDLEQDMGAGNDCDARQ